MNLEQFIQQHSPTLVSDKVTLPSLQKKPWQHTSYACRLIYQGNSFSFPYHLGSYYTEPPSLSQVLESLKLDCECGEYETFTDFCCELGMDSDSISDRDRYLACKRIAKGLRKLFGEEVYQQFRSLEDE